MTFVHKKFFCQFGWEWIWSSDFKNFSIFKICIVRKFLFKKFNCFFKILIADATCSKGKGIFTAFITVNKIETIFAEYLWKLFFVSGKDTFMIVVRSAWEYYSALCVFFKNSRLTTFCKLWKFHTFVCVIDSGCWSENNRCVEFFRNLKGFLNHFVCFFWG